MVEGDPGHRLCVIVVRELREHVVAEVKRIAGEFEVDVTLCDDVYGAVAELARATRSGALVVGQLRELARENSRFFRVAARNGARCCAWLDDEDALARRMVLHVVRAGVTVIDTLEEIEGMIEIWLARTGGHLGGPGASDQQWRASEAELNALLGQEADG